jgi:hypothetical protein
MTPTLMGRLQTRIFLAATIGVLWTAAITPALPRPAGMSSVFAYHVTFEALGLMTLLGLGWEVVYHVMQQARWDKDWPSLFTLLAVIPEAIPLWYVTHILDVIPGTTRLSSPIVPLYVIHISTTWVLTWLFMQGPLRVLHVRWRFEGGKVLVRAPGRARRRPSGLPGIAAAAAAVAPGAAVPVPAEAAAEGPPAENLAQGVLCGHGHFSHPEARYCVICGSAVLPLAGPGTLGIRPPAGILILADGGTVVLEHDLTVTVSAPSGDLGFVPLGDHAQAVAHIRIVGWQPVVSSPAHVMTLLLPGGSELRAEPHVPVPLMPGVELTVGQHRIRYESPHHAGPLGPEPAAWPLGPEPAAAPAPFRPAAAPGADAARSSRRMAAALGMLPGLVAGRMLAAGRMTLGWMMGRQALRSRRAAAAGAVTSALVIAVMFGFAGQLASEGGGARQLASGPRGFPATVPAAAGTRSPRGRSRPGSAAPPVSYLTGGPGRRAGGPAGHGRPAPPPPGQGNPPGTPGPAPTPSVPSPSATPTPTPTPTRTRTSSPSPSPSPTRTHPKPGSCIIRLLGLRVCGLL